MPRVALAILLPLAVICLSSCSLAKTITSVSVREAGNIVVGLRLFSSDSVASLGLYDIGKSGGSTNLTQLKPKEIAQSQYTKIEYWDNFFTLETGPLDRDRQYLLVAMSDSGFIGTRVVSHSFFGWRVRNSLVWDKGDWWNSNEFPSQAQQTMLNSSYPNRSVDAANGQPASPDPAVSQLSSTIRLEDMQKGLPVHWGDLVKGGPAFLEVYKLESGTLESFNELQGAIRNSELKRLWMEYCDSETLAGIGNAGSPYWLKRSGGDCDIVVIVNSDTSLRSSGTQIESIARFRLDSDGAMSELPVEGAPQK